jgi:ABC-2 type transport system ATP-binding protein
MRETPVAIVALDGLSRTFRFDWRSAPVTAVDGLTFAISPGEVVGLLGPNGCGKSTTLKLILGLIPPTGGRCWLWGRPVTEPAVRRRIGYLPEPLPLHRHLTGEEMVSLHGRLAGLPRRDLAERVDDVLETVGLKEVRRRRVATYSTGMLRRAGLASALVHRPELLVLDEPMAGVDPSGVEEMVAIIRAQKTAGRTVLLASHLLNQVEDGCDRVILLERGRMLTAGAVHQLAGEESRETWVIDRLPVAEQEALRQWLAWRGRRVHAVERTAARFDGFFLRRRQSEPVGPTLR